MCGIFAILNNDYNLLSNASLNNAFNNGKHRGPEYSVFTQVAVWQHLDFIALPLTD